VKYRTRRADLTTDELLAMLTAVAHPLRLRIVAELHLDRLEKAGMVTGQLELSEDGKAMKYFQLAPFELRVTAETIVAALQADEAAEANGIPQKGETDMKETER
jgi:hypothetical protein